MGWHPDVDPSPNLAATGPAPWICGSLSGAPMPRYLPAEGVEEHERPRVQLP